jgi:hypothetical protein
MRSFSERGLVVVVSLIFLSIAYLVRHAVAPIVPMVTEPPGKMTVSEFPPEHGATFVRQSAKRWWSTPVPPADPVIVPALPDLTGERERPDLPATDFRQL